MEPRTQRQIIYGALFSAIFIVIIFYIVSRFVSFSGTCFDNKQNGNEEGIDCGGRCISCEEKNLKAPQILKTQFFKEKEGIYDVVSQIKNLNQNFAATSFDYKFIFYNQQGDDIFEKSGTSWFLPRENKYIIENGLRVNKNFDRVDFVIENLKWQAFNKNLPQFIFSNISFGAVPSPGVGFYQVSALVNSRSIQDFRDVTINAVLFDNQDNILSVNKTKIANFRSSETKSLLIKWFNPFSGTVTKVFLDGQTNIFDLNNLIVR